MKKSKKITNRHLETPASTSKPYPSHAPTYQPKRSAYAKAYFEKLNDPRWQRKRLKIMERDAFQCQKCGDEKTKLNVHHEYYITGRDPWAYPDSALITLCQPCHGLERDFSGDYTPNTPRDWEALLETFVPCGEYIDFCSEFTALVNRSGKTRKQVLSWMMQNLSEVCRGENA